VDTPQPAIKGQLTNRRVPQSRTCRLQIQMV
jgi:hypothetical protein